MVIFSFGTPDFPLFGRANFSHFPCDSHGIHTEGNRNSSRTDAAVWAYTMTQNIKAGGLDFAKFLSQVPRARINERNRKEAIEQHKQFREAFSAGQCSFCGQPLKNFDVANPCRHWLLKPDGFRKEHFELLAKKHSWSVLAVRSQPVDFEFLAGIAEY